MSDKPVLGYWDIRGFAHQIRLLLKYLDVDFEDKLYGFGSGAEPSPDAWFSEKFTHGLDFPNVPYWKEGSFKLTESKAILKYVAKTRGPQLVPATPQDQAVSDMVEWVANDLQHQLVTLAYSPTGKVEKPLEESTDAKFKDLNKYLEKRDFVMGDKVMYVDFYVYEVLHEFTMYKADFLKPYPALEKYIERFESLPQIADLIKATAKYPCYSPFATIIF